MIFHEVAGRLLDDCWLRQFLTFSAHSLHLSKHWITLQKTGFIPAYIKRLMVLIYEVAGLIHDDCSLKLFRISLQIYIHPSSFRNSLLNTGFIPDSWNWWRSKYLTDKMPRNVTKNNLVKMVMTQAGTRHNIKAKTTLKRNLNCLVEFRLRWLSRCCLFEDCTLPHIMFQNLRTDCNNFSFLFYLITIIWVVKTLFSL